MKKFVSNCFQFERVCVCVCSSLFSQIDALHIQRHQLIWLNVFSNDGERDCDGGGGGSDYQRMHKYIHTMRPTATTKK